MITLYDIPSNVPGSAWSPNTFKARMALNFKGVPFETEWVEYPDIEQVYKKLGLASNGMRMGKPYYSLPVIHDSHTGKSIADSWKIVLYLDAQYPEAPRLIPKGSIALMKAFVSLIEEHTIMPVCRLAFVHTPTLLNPPSVEYFRRTRAVRFGKKLEDLFSTEEEKEQLALIVNALKQADSFFQLNEGDGFNAGCLVGGGVTYADLVVASWTSYMLRAFGEKSEEWKEIATVSDGRIAKLVARHEKLTK